MSAIVSAIVSAINVTQLFRELRVNLHRGAEIGPFFIKFIYCNLFSLPNIMSDFYCIIRKQSYICIRCNTKDAIMSTTAINSGKTLTSFRLNTKLVERLRELAKESNRSLNNYVETLLLDVVYHEPNEETVEALEEVKSGKKLDAFNRSELEKLIASL